MNYSIPGRAIFVSPNDELTMKISTVTIEAMGDSYSSKGRVVIDGQELPNVRSVKTSLSVDEPPVVTLDLNLVQNIKIETASIVVDGVVMPESVEQTLCAYLAGKYAATIDVTKLRSKCVRVIDVTTLGVHELGRRFRKGVAR